MNGKWNEEFMIQAFAIRLIESRFVSVPATMSSCSNNRDHAIFLDFSCFVAVLVARVAIDARVIGRLHRVDH